ncbi:hypothetical protein M9Y10_037921 [Tritrichomonas musculus]|uniref:Uncharacterized protein n=1 Tax=Tritrichomonas musculus TaxID=1915356 RepID=A0ABR2K7R8_9EUKA
MTKSEKTSPLKSAYASANQSISIAEDLIQGTIDPNDIDEFEIPTITRSLQALRHKAMISDDVKRQKRCEILISELNFKGAKNQSRPSSSLSNRKKSRKSSSRQTPIKGDSLSNLSSLQVDDSSCLNVELSDEELEKINNIIDSLLEGCEIESIDPDAILQLKYGLKQRKKLYIDDGNYLLVRKIDDQLLNLTRINQDYENSATLHSSKNVQKNNNLIFEAQKKLKNTEDVIEKYKAELEEELNKIEESKEAAKTKIFKEIEDDAKLLEEEATEVDLGFNFRPSSDLLDMRSLERKYVINSRYEEAAELRKNADKVEAEERKAYDQSARAAIDKKEHKKRLIHEQKSKKCEDYYRNIKEKTIKKYNRLIEVSRREAEAVKERITKLQSSQTEEKPASSLNDNSDNNISINSNSNGNNFPNENIDGIEDNFSNENNDENNPQIPIIEEEDVDEIKRKEHLDNIYRPYNNASPVSPNSPMADPSDSNQTDSNSQGTPILSRKKIIKRGSSKQEKNNDNDTNINNNESYSDLKIDANNLVQNEDQEVDGEKSTNDSNSENNNNFSDANSNSQTKPQSKGKRTKKIVKKVKKVAKKSS